jgi:F-type H+-transporting ATPase subunit epsilon
MAETIALEIVTPDGLKLREAVSELTAPSVDGEFGVLPQHRPLLAALQTGIVTYVQNGKSHAVAVGPGYVEVAGDRALVLTDRFIRKADVDPVRTRLELKEADEQLDHYKGEPSDPAYADLVERELWAAAQLELYGDPPPPRVRSIDAMALKGHESYARPISSSDGDGDGSAPPSPGADQH